MVVPQSGGGTWIRRQEGLPLKYSDVVSVVVECRAHLP